MSQFGNIEGLRQTSYDCYRNTGLSISEAADRSYRYVLDHYYARSLCSAYLLEQVYQNSLRGSVPPSRPAHDGGSSDPFADLEDMMNDLPGFADSSFNTRVPRNSSSRQYRTEERVPSGESVRQGRERARESYVHTEFDGVRGDSYEYTHTYSSSAAPPHGPQPRRTNTEGPRSPPLNSRRAYTQSRVPSEFARSFYEGGDRDGEIPSEFARSFYEAEEDKENNDPRPRRNSRPYFHTPPSASRRNRSPPVTPRAPHSRPYFHTPPSGSRRNRSPPATSRRTHNARPRTPPSYTRPRTPPPNTRPRTPPPNTRPRARAQSPPRRARGVEPRTDLYTVLGISRTATAEEIRKAHRTMSLKWHPDRCSAELKDKATEMMAEINQANDVLRDPVKRRHYDQTGMMA
ncbi:hypothetical protein GMOD_00003314 [Pyrenophora seminiperda CCB06]|uniref:J domain-containing protein n=1 Tax=Pyrenophora seminiperda CCB06 TaxID=1302712 RepID=A0A3M7MIM4_9PLEO|nr:hypothetical protein GMOD_00003314 [Pyrenophora seminiperda CCB06]